MENDINLKSVSPKAGTLDTDLRSFDQIMLTFSADILIRQDAEATLVTPDAPDTPGGVGTPGNDGAAPRAVYTLQGIRLCEDATDAQISALAPGLYIIAGKKVLVK